jgi:hypothetical protein
MVRPRIRGERSFRNASISNSKRSLWVIHVISGAGSDFRFSPESDRIDALREATLRANKTLSRFHSITSSLWALKVN